DRIALPDIGPAERLDRDDLAAQVDGFAVDRRIVETAGPREVLPADEVDVEAQLDPSVLEFADVLELRIEETLRRREAHRDQRVERALVVVCEVDPDTAAEEARLETGLDLAAAFRSERRI